MTAETATTLYDEVLDNMRKATGANLKMQQDMLRQWAMLWPGFPSPQLAWIDKVRDFQRQWSSAVSDLARKHRETFDRQYQAALESLEEALRVGDASNPEEYRKRIEQLCRKTLDCVREVSEAQMQEFHDAMKKWSEVVTKTGT